MSAPPSTSSSSFSYVFTYDVFLSFRGIDTRHGFTGNLYKALHNKGIRTFFDDEELRKGEEITPALVTAIEESRIAIPVFSKNYAFSSFCLAELVKIMECIRGKGRLVLPVFYDIDPSDVRHQRGSYGEALTKQEERFKDDKEKVKIWREALHQAANLSGEDFKLGNEYEYVFIEKVVKEISNKISHIPLHVADYPVGLESRVLEVNSFLNDGSDGGVHMVGLYGIGGIGKTTLARAVYNLIADQFDGLCFLENVRENSIKHGLEHLQETILSKILGEKDIKIVCVSEGISLIKQRFESKKVLLVLDDVSKLQQLQAIAGKLDWFGFGSKIIITTRDKHLLANHGVEIKYEVKDLNKNEAIELLSWNAFKYEKIDPSYMDILNKVVSYASGLPLALAVIGSNLSGRSVEEWISALGEYKKIPNKDIQKTLKVSFDALEEYQQKFFLDIACCYKEYMLEEVEHILHAHYDICPKFGIGVLVERSLVEIKGGFVTLHDLIQDMGREIVRQESPENLGKRSRLWLPEDIMQVLQENIGTSEIKIIILKAPIFEVIEWDGEAFKEMKNLKVLIIQNGSFSKAPRHLPNSLRVLKWKGYPSHFLPSDFHPKKLAVLNLTDSCFRSFHLVKLLKEYVNNNTRVLDFSGNKRTTLIPDVSDAPNLEEICFAGCENLIKIDESVGFLGKLRTLNVKGCPKLRSLPSLKLPSLEYLYFSRCSSLERFPEILGKIEKLTELELYGTSIKEFPFSICNLTGLQHLVLDEGNTHRGIFLSPGSISMLPKLENLEILKHECLPLPNQDEDVEQVSSMLSSNETWLDFQGCNLTDDFLQIFLPRFSSVENLVLSHCRFTILPACIEECHFLRRLYLDDCQNLQEIRKIPPNIKELYANNCTSLSRSSRRLLLSEKLHEEGGNKAFFLPGTRIPKWFEHRTNAPWICFWFRNKLPAISVCVLHNKSSFFPDLQMIINDNIEVQLYKDDYFERQLDHGHTYIYDLDHDVDEDHLEKEWNQAVISLSDIYDLETEKLNDLFGMQIGLHIVKERSNMDNIRFTNLLLQKEDHRSMDMAYSHIQYMRLQPASLELHVGQGTELALWHPPPALKRIVNWYSNSKLISSTATMTAQGYGIESRKRNSTSMLDLNNEPIETFYHAPSIVDLDSDSISSRLDSDSDTSSEGDSGNDLWMHNYGWLYDLWMPNNELPSLRPWWAEPLDFENLESKLMQLASTSATEQVDRALLDHRESCPVESSQAPSFAGLASRKTKNIGLMLDLNKEPIDTFYHTPPKTGLVSDSIMSSLASDTAGERGCEIASRKRKRSTLILDLNTDLASQFSSETKEPFKEIEDSSNEAEEQSSIRKRKASSPSAETLAKIHKTATEQGVLTISSKNHDKDSDVELVEATTVPTAISEPSPIINKGKQSVSSTHSENVDQPVNAFIEMQPPSPQPLDPLAELERVLLGSYDLSQESAFPTAASCSEIQTSEVVIILQNLEPLLHNPLESLIADGERKQQILDCLSKLGQLEDHIAISLQSIIAQVRDFFEDIIHNFPSIQQTLVDYSYLEETRSKFLENLKQAKAKQARIDAEMYQERNQLEGLAAETAELELRLKAAVEKHNEIQLAIKNGEAEKNKILEDASVWLLEGKQVMEKMRSSEHAYREAQSSKTRLEGRLATLKEAFAANKP